MRVPYACVDQDLQSAGMSCNDEPCHIYLELNAVAAKGDKILAAGDLHSDSVTLDSILLQSDDAGATWKEPAARNLGAAVEQVEIFDAQHAWAAGETQYPLPRDPFVLTTTDGGTSWTRNAIGEDGGDGSIQRFWFDSALHGEAVVDVGQAAAKGRYVTYESDSGGVLWMQLSAADDPPQLEGAPIGVPEWRIWPSKDGKASDVEKRSGDDWSRVAGFLIEVASCRTEPEKINPPH